MAIDLRDQRRRRGVQFSLPAQTNWTPPVEPPDQGTRVAPVPRLSDAQRAAIAAAASGGGGQDDGNAWGRGLGFLVNNPVTETVLKPLQALDVPRRVALSALQEGIDAIGPGDASWGDFADQVADETFGFGTITGDLTGNKWIDRAIGLAGDLAFDPIMYLTFGASAATKGVATSGRAARAQRVADAATELRRLGQLDDDAVNALRRVAEQGYSTADGPLREALGLRKAGARLQVPFTQIESPVIPGTRGVARAVNAPIEATRGAFNRSAPGQRAMRARTPIGMEKAYPAMFSGQGSNRDFENALTTFREEQFARTAGQSFRGIAAQELRARMPGVQEELHTRFGGDLNAMLRETETGARDTTLNAISQRMIAIADELGVKLPEIEDIGYVPHMLSPEFRALLDSNHPLAEEAMRRLGIRRVDTLRDSGFLSQRAFRPDPTGARRPISIGGQELRITEGSIAEINEKMAALFPELRTTALETSPNVLFERYIAGVADDVGRRSARQRLLAEGAPGIVRRTNIEGQSDVVPHGTKLDYGDGVFRSVRDEEKTAAANAAEAERLAAEQAARSARGGAQRRRVAEGLRTQQEATRGPIQASLDEIGWSEVGPDGTVSGVGRLRQLQDRLTEIEQTVRSAPRRKRLSQEAVAKEVRQLSAEIGQITRQMNAMERTVRGRSQAEIAAYTEQVRTRARDLFDKAEQLRGVIARYTGDEGAAGVREMQRKLREGVDRAQAALDELDVPTRPQGPVDQDALDAARAAARSAGEPTPQPRVPESAPAQTAESVPEVVAARDEITSLTRRKNELAEAEAALARAKKPKTKEPLPLSTKREKAARGKAIAKAQKDLDSLTSNPDYQGLDAKLSAAKARFEHLQRPAEVRDEVAVLERRLAELNQAERDVTNARRMQELPGEDSAKMRDIEERLLRSTQRQERPDYGELQEMLRTERYRRRKTPAPPTKRGEAIYEAEVRLRELRANPDYQNLTEKLAAARGPQVDPALLARRAEINKRARALRNAEISLQRAALTPEEIQLAERNLKPTGVWDRMFPPRYSDTGERIPVPADRGISRIDFYNRLAVVLNKDYPASLGREVKETRSALRPAFEEAGRATRGEGRVAQMAADAEAEIGYRRTLPTLRQAQTRRKITQIKQRGADELRAIDNEVSGGRAEYAAVTREAAEERQRRHGLRTAFAKGGKDPVGRLEASRRGMRPTQKALDEAREAGVTDVAGLSRVQPLNSAVDDVEEMVRLNPDATDADLLRAERLARIHRRQLAQATEHDLSANQLNGALRAASNGRLVDVVTAQIDQSLWKLMPEGDVFVSNELARMMSNIAKVRAEPKWFGQTLTAFTNFFKTYATLSPGFHVRNAMSATFMNVADGVPLQRQMEGLRTWRQFLKAKDPLAFIQGLDPQMRTAFEAVFGSGAGGRFFEEGVAEATMIGRTRLKEGIFRNRATVWSQRAGERVEGAVRLGMAIDTVKNGGTLEDALNRITRIHFDYSQVSQFDENAKRLIPFWTFMSRNLPMQISQMWMKPRTYLHYQSLVRNFSVDPAEFTPEYILEAGGFDTGATTPGGVPGMGEGMPIFLQPDLPHTRLGEEVAKLEGLASGDWGKALSDFNPFFTAPIEFATGRDLYTGRTYKDDDVRKLSGPLDMAMLPVLALFGQTHKGQDGVYADEKATDLLRSLLPPLDRISRLAPQAAGGQSGDRQLESYLRFLGLPVRTVSDEQRQNERASRYYDALDDRRLRQALAGLGE